MMTLYAVDIVGEKKTLVIHVVASDVSEALKKVDEFMNEVRPPHESWQKGVKGVHFHVVGVGIGRSDVFLRTSSE